jgi:hypothetical protein
MTIFEMLFVGGAVGALVFMAILASGRTGHGKWQVAALLAAGFLAYSLVPILHEGPLGFIANHTVNHWGVQVWLDLLLALSLALFLAAPRARQAGMNLVPWLILVLCSGSIGLLAFLARLFWLEERNRQGA